MPILGAIIVPHPPVILPEVGRGREREIQATIDACRAAARRVADWGPDVLILSSPHTVCYADYFHVSPGEGASGAAVLDFIYDESGKPFALKYSTNGTSFQTYYYVLNLQGDVVKLIHYIPGFEYESVATYEYDAWGNIVSSSGRLAEINPLRYRGYYYDSETGFYYLQSRYYDPENHRFINADSYASTDSSDAIACNMFAYCGNNPVLNLDPTGEWSWKGFLAGIATVAVGVDAVA